MTSPHGNISDAYRPPFQARNGIVTSGHALASQAGVRTMMTGGNAIDAAIATAAALGVVEPTMSGMGGDGFLLIYDANEGEITAVNATGPAPMLATREKYLADGGIPMHGMRSVSVPGVVDGWLLAHERYGVLPLEEVLKPAIELCEDGFPISARLAMHMRDVLDEFNAAEYSRPIFTHDGEAMQPGDLLVQKNLGASYRLLAREGREAFYEGAIADAVDAFSRQHDGYLRADDLRQFHAHWTDPIVTSYRGYDVYEMPPNSSGHILLQELNMVERLNLQEMGCNTAESVHWMVEAKKLAFADREKFVADPNWVDIPLDGLLSKAYAAERLTQIDPKHAALDVQAGEPDRFGDTTCFCTADRAGNAVCQLQSIQSAFGSCLVAGDTGILLNNRMTYWHLEEGHPNCLMPGKRVRHTMNNVLVTKDGKPVLICGTPGADTQVQTNLQLVTHILDFGMNPQEAVEAPRWRSLQMGMESTIPHTCDDVLELEARFPAEVRAELEARGHVLEILGEWGGRGNAMAILVDPETGVLSGGADPRNDGYVCGW